jgi:hypothetical protein
MTVIAFQPKPESETSGWDIEERNRLEALYASRAQCGEVSEWAVEATENGDPQFFLIGPVPACECVLSISRVSDRYVMEDGNGRLIGEMASLEEVMQSASRLRLGRRGTSLLARIALAWAGLREFVEEKMEPLAAEMTEVAEVLTHVVPQVAAFA